MTKAWSECPEATFACPVCHETHVPKTRNLANQGKLAFLVECPRQPYRIFKSRTFEAFVSQIEGYLQKDLARTT